MNDQPPTPQPPIVPAAPLVPNPTNGMGSVNPGASQPKKRNLLWLWITIAGVAAIVIIGVVLAIVMIVLPPIQAKGTASDYVKALKNDDSAAMTKLSGSGSSDYTKNITSGLKDASYKETDVTKKNQVGYVVDFTVTGSSTIHNIVVIVKDGKVSTLNINTNGSSQTGDASTSPNDVSSSSTTSSNSQCLVLSDFANNGIDYIDQSALDTTSNNLYLDEFFFQPDSTDYLSDSSANDEIDKMVTFYKGASGKDFNLQLVGTTHEDSSSSAGTTLANQRAQKVKDALVAKGVDASRVVLGDPSSGVNQNDDTGDSDRRIDISIVRPDSCLGSQS